MKNVQMPQIMNVKNNINTDDSKSIGFVWTNGQLLAR